MVRSPETVTQAWCGALSFENPAQRTHGAAEVIFDLRTEWVAIEIDGRPVAVLDRDGLRAWFAHPNRPAHVRDIALDLNGETLTLYVGQAWCAVVPQDITEALLTRV